MQQIGVTRFLVFVVFVQEAWSGRFAVDWHMCVHDHASHADIVYVPVDRGLIKAANLKLIAGDALLWCMMAVKL